MFFKGFKFGMLLQLAIGPVFMLILQIAIIQGFRQAELGVLGVFIVDMAFILAAILGVGLFLEQPKIKKRLYVFGAVVLVIFGVSTLLNLFHINIIPSFKIGNGLLTNHPFVQLVALTASNPLTILFWAGVFSSKITEEKMEGMDMYVFGFGAGISTLLFLSCIAIVGSKVAVVLNNNLILILNACVGLFLIYAGVKMFLKKKSL